METKHWFFFIFIGLVLFAFVVGDYWTLSINSRNLNHHPDLIKDLEVAREQERKGDTAGLAASLLKITIIMRERGIDPPVEIEALLARANNGIQKDQKRIVNYWLRHINVLKETGLRDKNSLVNAVQQARIACEQTNGFKGDQIIEFETRFGIIPIGNRI